MQQVTKAVAVIALFASVLSWPARLFDADSYLHLALARLIAEHGFVSGLPWARLSALGAHYGDKELLFHLLLVPFTLGADLERQGAYALALLCSAIALSLARLGSHALGRAGALVPWLVFAGSGSFVLRAMRLRPELLSLLLLVWVIWALARERYGVAALLSMAFALCHTAFHSLLGLALLWFVWQSFVERRWVWRLPLSVSAGVVAGLLVHPQFPDNLRIFWIQNVEFWRYKAVLDVGGEFQPHSAFNLLQLDGAWFMALIVLWRARVPATDVRDADDVNGATSAAAAAAADGGTMAALQTARRMAAYCWIAGLGFFLMFLQMGRFATLAVPLCTLAFAFELRARNLRIGPRIALLGDRSVPFLPLMAAIGLLATANALATAFVNWRMSDATNRNLSPELVALSARLPTGARVAANWDDAEQYAFFAPQARYLNVLDPVFMAVAEPVRFAAWTRLREGNEPDAARVLARDLSSEYVAFSGSGREALIAGLEADPRFERLHAGQHRLYRLRPNADAAFVRDWTPRADQQPPEPHGGSGYVDASTRIRADGCAVLKSRHEVATASSRLFELAAWGPTALFLDGAQTVQLAAPGEARLGHGVLFPVRWASGAHEIAIRTCLHQGRAGFYLLERAPLIEAVH